MILLSYAPFKPNIYDNPSNLCFVVISWIIWADIYGGYHL